MGMMVGCELLIRRWVRDHASALQCVWCQEPLVKHLEPCTRALAAPGTPDSAGTPRSPEALP